MRLILMEIKINTHPCKGTTCVLLPEKYLLVYVTVCHWKLGLHKIFIAFSLRFLFVISIQIAVEIDLSEENKVVVFFHDSFFLSVF